MTALEETVALLACPECDRRQQRGRRLHSAAAALRCDNGHSFDIARQGYVGLLTGSATKMTGDTPAMLDARATFQRAGHFAPIAEAVATACRGTSIAEIGAGTGYYLAAALEHRPQAHGIALDVAKPAVRRAARAHPRMAAVLADAWRGLPIRDGVLDTVLSVFAPRNPAEVVRVLAPGGRFIVVTPTPRHLQELIEPLDMVRVDPAKAERLAAALAAEFTPAQSRLVEYRMPLNRADIGAVVGMGPSAFHRAAPGDDPRIDELAGAHVTASVDVAVFTAQNTPAR